MFTSRHLIPFTFLICFGNFANSEKILFYMGFASHSHRVALQPLATKLASRGHKITFFSPIEPEILNANITEFCPEVLKKANDNAIKSAGDATGRLMDRHYDHFGALTLWDIYGSLFESLLQSDEFIKFLKTSKFDLIIHDYPGEEYIYAYAHHTKAKVIAFASSATQLPADFDVFGFPIESWFTGFYTNPYSYIPDRVFNCFHIILQYFVYRDYHLNKLESLLKKTFDFEFPPLIELMRNTDLIFLNEHFSAAYSRPLPPNIIPVGGMHVNEYNEALPQEIQDFLADTDQFIYISFGSVIKVEYLPATVQQYFFDSIQSFHGTKFLWKWEGDVPLNFPNNVLTRSWFPQHDVLAHPKCKGFITQGGQMSIHQAVFNGVPVIVVPAFGDQPFNAKSAEYHTFGIHLELIDITKETLTHSIDEILHNSNYRESAEAVSKRFRDRPMSAVDTAVWWVEYVLRHDTSHLRSEGIYLSWYHKRFLDVWVILFLVALIIFVGLVFCLRMLLRFLM